MEKQQKKLSKKKKFLILSICYIATFIITVSVSIAWFASGDWSNNSIYMGGPVYIALADFDGVTSGSGNLNVDIAEDYLYPGANLLFQTRVKLIGTQTTVTKDNGDTLTIRNVSALIRAKLNISIVGLDEEKTTNLYNSFWTPLKTAIETAGIGDNTGRWYFYDDGEGYFYYMVDNDRASVDTDLMQFVGGTGQDEYIEFLNNVIVNLTGEPFTNEYADCTVQFRVNVHAIQAFLPWSEDDPGFDPLVNTVGVEKPFTIENAKIIFNDCVF